MENSKRITPFSKQCFVTAGVSISLAQFSSVVGFTAILLPQLRQPDSIISIDDEAGSWIAAVPGFAVMVGTIIVPSIMAKLGRKKANVISVLPVLIGWIIIVSAKTIPMIIFARLLQGLSMGMSSALGSILIGEYTSPKNRGMFLSMISVVLSIATLSVHTIGSYISWQTTAVVFTVVTVVDLMIVLMSPESPSWLADQGRYEECRKVFRWLRGDNEEDELNKMIEANKLSKELKSVTNASNSCTTKMKQNVSYSITAIKKREFYRPIILMMHIYIVQEWGGLNFLTPFMIDIINQISGENVNVSLLVITLDIQRLLSNASIIYVIKKLKRRTLFFSTTGLAVIVYLVTAGYVYAKVKGVLPFDHPWIGALLIHLHMFTVATGTLPVPLIISGEVFPMKYRSLAGSICAFFFSVHLTISIKTFSALCSSIGIYGTYTLYGGILAYCMLVTWFYLPETKDRTLQEIEEEFTGKVISSDDVKAVESLTTWNDKE